MEITDLLQKKDFSLKDVANLNWNFIPFLTKYEKCDISDFNTTDELEQFLTKNNHKLNKDVSGIYAYSNIALGVFKIEIGNPIVYSIINDYKRIEHIQTFIDLQTDMRYFKEEQNDILWIEINDSVLNSNYAAIKKIVEKVRIKHNLYNSEQP